MYLPVYQGIHTQCLFGRCFHWIDVSTCCLPDVGLQVLASVTSRETCYQPINGQDSHKDDGARSAFVYDPRFLSMYLSRFAELQQMYSSSCLQILHTASRYVVEQYITTVTAYHRRWSSLLELVKVLTLLTTALLTCDILSHPPWKDGSVTDPHTSISRQLCWDTFSTKYRTTLC